ncbi:MAG: hypothetical protein SGPRY_001039, partial [Prymnesium sp.]
VLDEKDATCGSPRVRRSLELGVGRHTCGRELLPPPADKRISRTQLHIDVAHDSKVVVRREGQNPSFVLSVGSEVPVELEKGVPHHLLPGSVIWLSRRPVSSLLIHPIDIVPCSVPAHPIAILPQEGEAPDASRAPLNARFEDPRPPVWEVMLGGTFKAYEPSVQRQLEEAYGVDLPEVEIKVRGEDYVIDLREKRQMPKFNRAKARQVRRRTSTSAQAREKAVHEGVGGGEIEKGMQARKEGRVIEDGCTTGGGEKVHVMNEGNKEGTVLESDIETMPTGADQNRTSEERKGKSCTMEGDARDRATEGGGREIAIEGHVTKSEVESGMLTRTMGVHGATSTMDVDRTRSMIDPVGEKECPRVGTLEGEEVVDRAHSSSKQKKKRSLAEMLAQQEAEVSALLADSSPSKLKETTGEAPTPGLFEGGHDTTSPLTPSPPGGGSCSMSGERSAEMPAPGLIESWHQLPAPPPPSELVKGHVQTRLFADDPSAGERTLAFPLLCAATDCQFDHEVALRVGVEEVRRFLEQHAADKLTLLLTERSGSLEEAHATPWALHVHAHIYTSHVYLFELPTSPRPSCQGYGRSQS